MTPSRFRLLAVSLCLLPLSNGYPQDRSTSESSHQHTNALAGESSPYLLMHAHNPVDWKPWNEQTLQQARESDKPIFLSIGYSSCHWCHVMERESFLDEEIANFLNEHFVCIKVDREERPDVDEIYMHALLTIRRGGGGWPLSMFMTPEAKPFFGGTYWPARDGDRGTRTGFLTIVQKIEEHFRDNRELVERDAELVTNATRKALAGQPPSEAIPMQRSWAEDAIARLKQNYDPEFGGFRFDRANPQVPKFPEPSNLLFLRDQLTAAQGRAEVETMLLTTCERMMLGGIQDHLGGGFHRYSVDRFWAIPHFEKMLYDNGQLATVYAEAYRLTGRADFRRTVEGILEFVERELTAPEGGFYSALDAESEGEEGKFYRWTRDELAAELSTEQQKLFFEIYRINEAPNFEKEFYAPQLKQSLARHAEAMGISEDELVQQLLPIRQKLLKVRERRPRPLLDHKILTAWNGLMIRGYADAGRLLKSPRYIEIAARAAKFALQHLVDQEGRVLRTYTDGEAKLNGYLIDYACLIDGLIALHQATRDRQWADAARKLQSKQDELFLDSKNGGYFNTSSDHEVLIARSKQMNDGVIPSGNSVAAGNLLYLGKFFKDAQLTQRAKSTVDAASPTLTAYSHALPRMLITVQSLIDERD